MEKLYIELLDRSLLVRGDFFSDARIELAGQKVGSIGISNGILITFTNREGKWRLFVHANVKEQPINPTCTLIHRFETENHPFESLEIISDKPIYWLVVSNNHEPIKREEKQWTTNE